MSISSAHDMLLIHPSRTDTFPQGRSAPCYLANHSAIRHTLRDMVCIYARYLHSLENTLSAIACGCASYPTLTSFLCCTKYHATPQVLTVGRLGVAATKIGVSYVRGLLMSLWVQVKVSIAVTLKNWMNDPEVRRVLEL